MKVERVWSPVRIGGISGRITDMIGFCLKVTVKLMLSASRDDVVLAVTNPPLVPYASALAARLRGARFILLVHDVYPDVISRAGKLKETSWIYRALQAASRWLYKRADRIVVIGRDMRDLVSSKLLTPTDKIVLIENWAEVEEIAALPREHRPPLVLQHAGNLGRTHDVEILLKAAAALEKDLMLHFVGGGRREPIDTDGRPRDPKNVIRRPFAPRELRAQSLADCDAAVIAFLPGMAGVSVPSRMYNVMASGRPLVAACDLSSELALTIKDHDIGWVVPAKDLASLIEVLRTIVNDPMELRSKGDRARKLAESRYTKKRSLEGFDRVVDAVLK
jgi:glycosyltransferase involved in cell wall biosynthesis